MGMRMGIPLVGGTHWHGGITYLEAIIRAFRALPKIEQPELYLLIDKSRAHDLVTHEYFLNALDGFIVIGCVGVLPEEMSARSRSIKNFQEITDYVDLIFPVNSDCLPGFAYASWLPDFQHRHLPHLFSEGDFLLREEAINFVLAAADNIVVSSETVKKDLMHYYPPFHGHVEVVPFFSRFDSNYFEQDPIDTASNYQLPERYLICCNQFWQHKNHDTLIRALALTKYPVQLVCTGAQQDYRNKDWFEQLQQLIVDLGVVDRITLLGFIPRVDQIQLMRRSLGIVQPSRFEGWSTVMEDARGLGKMVISSDLAIHREQAVPNARFFSAKSPSELAILLDQAYIEEIPGPHVAKELEAQKDVELRQVGSAKKLLCLFEKILHVYNAESETSFGKSAISVGMRQTSKIFQLNEMLSEKELEIQSKDAALIRMTQGCVEKEAVIQELSAALAAYRAAESG